MNKWRDSCIRNQESLKGKIERLDKEIMNVKARLQEKRLQDAGTIDESKTKEQYVKIENSVSENEPLIISLISTAFEDLKLIHKNLNIFCS